MEATKLSFSEQLHRDASVSVDFKMLHKTTYMVSTLFLRGSRHSMMILRPGASSLNTLFEPLINFHL